MISDVDDTLAALLRKEFERADVGAPAKEAEIVFEPPTNPSEAKGDRPRISLHLLDVRENLALRDDSFALKRAADGRTGTLRRSSVRLDLGYLVTVEAASARQEHLLLSEVLAAFYRNGTVSPELLSGSLAARGANSVALSVAQPDSPIMNHLPAMWNNSKVGMRPTLGLVVTALFDPFDSLPRQLVREAVMGVVGRAPDGEDSPILEERRVQASLAGFVSHDGEPLPGVQVELLARASPEKDGADPSEPGEAIKVARSDARGVFVFLGAPPGVHQLRFSLRNFETLCVSATAPPPGRPDLLEPCLVSLKKVDSKRFTSPNGAAPALASASARGETSKSKVSTKK